MDDFLTVSYKNSGSYKVVINKDYSGLGQEIKELFPNLRRICIVSDSNVAGLYLSDVKSALSSCCETVIEYVFEA